jgi:hypothetical protein
VTHTRSTHSGGFDVIASCPAVVVIRPQLDEMIPPVVNVATALLHALIISRTDRPRICL